MVNKPHQILHVYWILLAPIFCSSPLVLSSPLQHQERQNLLPPFTFSGTSGPRNATGLSSLRSKIGKSLWELVSSTSEVLTFGADQNDSNSPRIQHNSGNYDTGSNNIPAHFNLQMRLQKLDYYFRYLDIREEDCKQRFLCELSRDQETYSPLSNAFLDETSDVHNDRVVLSSRLLTSNEGTRLLTYIEASQRGLNREGCDVWMYRCPKPVEAMIDMKSLLTWREVSKFLTVKMVAKRKYY